MLLLFRPSLSSGMMPGKYHLGHYTHAGKGIGKNHQPTIFNFVIQDSLCVYLSLMLVWVNSRLKSETQRHVSPLGAACTNSIKGNQWKTQKILLAAVQHFKNLVKFIGKWLLPFIGCQKIYKKRKMHVNELAEEFFFLHFTSFCPYSILIGLWICSTPSICLEKYHSTNTEHFAQLEWYILTPLTNNSLECYIYIPALNSSINIVAWKFCIWLFFMRNQQFGKLRALLN